MDSHQLTALSSTKAVRTFTSLLKTTALKYSMCSMERKKESLRVDTTTLFSIFAGTTLLMVTCYLQVQIVLSGSGSDESFAVINNPISSYIPYIII